MELLEIHLLGGFRVAVDSVPVADGAWPRRAAELVKLLALAPDHSLQRERIVEEIWPSLEPEAGFANVHKAAHLARSAMRDPGAIVLRRGQVLLAPGARVETDVERFEATGSPELYTGELLPGDRYESWASEPRERLRRTYRDALRAAERWDALAADDPADEDAQRALMQAEVEAGNRHAALRRFQRLRETLARSGLAPAAETVSLHEEIARGPAAVAPLTATGPIVGRERELASALAAWQRAGARRGGALIVTGEAGVGKTRLCEELLARAAEADWTTLRGVAREEEGAAPYGPVAEALDRLLLDRPDLAGQVTEAAQAELARFSVAFPGAAVPAGQAAERQRIFAAVAQLLAAAARERGAVLLVEDVHAADEATVQLLHALARAARAQRLLVVLSFRDETVTPSLAQVRAGLLEQRLATEIRLQPLERDAALTVAREVAAIPPAGDVEEAIWRLAAGNPFFTEELAAAIRPDGTLAAPLRLYEILHARFSRLEPPIRAALAGIGVVGGSFTADELAALGDLGEEDAFAALDAGLAAGVVCADGPGYRFRHGLVREALVHALPPHRRAAAHREAAALLAAQDAPPGRVAYQLIEGGRATEAVPWLVRAARAAWDVAAYADALDFVEAALPHANGSERHDLLPLQADLEFATGDPRAASAYADAIAAGCRGRAELRANQARALLASGDVQGATAALADARGRTLSDRARLTVTRGIVAWFREDIESAQQAADEGKRLAVAAGLARETMEATQLGAALAHTRGDWGARVQLDLVETLRRPELAATLFDAHVCIAEWVLMSGEPYEQLAAAAGALRTASEQSGARRAQAFAATVLGEAKLLAGDLEAAREHLQEAVALSGRVQTRAGESLARLRLAETALAQAGEAGAQRTRSGREGPAGEAGVASAGDDAAPLLDEALRLARTSTLPHHLLYLVFATKVRAAADPSEALALVDEAETLLDVRPRCPFCPMGFCVAAAIACARAGSLERSRGYLAAGERTVLLWPGGPWPAAVAEARAALAFAEGAPDEAGRLLSEAAAGFARAGQPLVAARAREAARNVQGAGTTAARGAQP